MQDIAASKKAEHVGWVLYKEVGGPGFSLTGTHIQQNIGFSSQDISF